MPHTAILQIKADYVWIEKKQRVAEAVALMVVYYDEKLPGSD